MRGHVSAEPVLQPLLFPLLLIHMMTPAEQLRSAGAFCAQTPGKVFRYRSVKALSASKSMHGDRRPQARCAQSRHVQLLDGALEGELLLAGVTAHGAAQRALPLRIGQNIEPDVALRQSRPAHPRPSRRESLRRATGRARPVCVRG